MTKQKHNLSHQSGIALLVTIVLTSIMLSAVLLVSKEMIDEIQNSTRIDNSLIAYYAAEAGLEDALLEWHYNNDAEISKQNDDNPSVDVTDKSNNTPRMVNLDNDTRIANTNPKDPKKSYYELTMWSKQDQIENQVVLRDDVAEFVIPNMTDSIDLNWTSDQESEMEDPGINSGFRVEITVFDENGNILKDGKNFTKPNISSVTLDNTLLGSGKKIIRVKPSYVDISSYDPITKSYSEGKDLPNSEIPSIKININQTKTADLISGVNLNIESVGYYGGVARKIGATVDRSTGSILNIFDYAIYSGSDLIKSVK